MKRLSGGLAVALVLATVSCSPGSQERTASVDSRPVKPLAIRISGKTFVDQEERPLRLLGVNRSGTEYACAEGWGIFDGPSDEPSIAAISSWHANAVRVPLNEACWLGREGIKAELSGDAYRQAIRGYVDALHRAGLFVVLDLHWSAPGTEVPLKSPLMPNADHSPRFWRSVAEYFKDDPALVFDLFNEPREIDWACLRDGCTTPYGWQAAGMQSLVDAVRSTGARQPVLVPGLNFANDLSQWLSFKPNDPARQLGASFHVYKGNNCRDIVCWEASVTPLTAHVPVVATELGEGDCDHVFIDEFMQWADVHSVSYLGWSWNPYSCTDQPALISSYDGTPTNYGVGLRDHLSSLSATTSPTRP